MPARVIIMCATKKTASIDGEADFRGVQWLLPRVYGKRMDQISSLAICKPEALFAVIQTNDR